MAIWLILAIPDNIIKNEVTAELMTLKLIKILILKINI